MRAPWRVPVVLGALLPLTACAYSFNDSNLPSHIKTLEIPVAENQTLEVTLAEELTSALTDRFIEDNSMRVVQGDADALLEADITGYENRVFGYNSEQRADEYIIVMTVDMAMRDRVRNKELWQEKAVRGAASYFPDGPDGSINNELDARLLALKQVVDRALSRTTESW